MSRCDFDNPSLTCPVCGYVAKRLPTYRECRPVPVTPWRPYKVGDAVERWLTSIGVTKERVEEWTRTAGKPGGCGCQNRQQWLNEWGDRVQIAIRSGLLEFRGFVLPN